MRFWDRLEVRLLGSVAVVAAAMSLASFGWDAYRLRVSAERSMTDRARAVTQQFLAVRSFVAQAERARLVDHPESFRHLDPVAVARVVGEIFGAGTPAQVREVWVSSTKALHRPDEIEAAALQAFRDDPKSAEFATITPASGEGADRLFRYVAPIHLEVSCLSCHRQGTLQAGREGSPPAVGDLMGALSIGVPISAYEADVAASIRSRLVFTLILTGLSLAVLAVLLRRQVTGPLSYLTQMASRFATGDLTAAPPPQGAAGETAVLAGVMNSMASALKDLYSQLEARVDERTRRLSEANEKLRHKQRELERAQQVQSEFLATVSHELRTPLTSILAFTELLLDDDQAVERGTMREYLSDIRESAQRLYGQINDLLDLARIEAGRMQIQTEVFDVKAVAQAALRRIGPMAARKGLRTIGPADPHVPVLVRADRGRTEQVVMNLLSNAVKFTPAGSVEVRVVPPSDEEPMVRVSVIDTGIGVRPEHQAVIFEKFRQVDSSTSREYAGSGLGLALVRHLAEMQGGRVWVTSEVGRGSTFTFTVPPAGVWG